MDAFLPDGGVVIYSLPPKVGDTLTAIVEPADADVDYQWYSGTSPDAVVNAITGETGATLTVTNAMEGQYLKVVVIDDELNTAESDVTDEVTSEELALKNVEAGALLANGNANIVIAYFNQEVGDLTPTDVQIRRVSDDQLFSVENINMSSDGMTATMTLTNTSSAGAAVVGLEPNVDYRLIVTTEDGTASKVFSIPGTITDATVYAVDPTKKTISIEQQHWDASTNVFDGRSGVFAVPEDLDVNFEEILGTTVTVQYDKNNNITKLNRSSSEYVVYGAFKLDATKKTYTDLATGDVYTLQSKSGAQNAANYITRATKGTTNVAGANWTTGSGVANNLAIAADKNVAWAKLIVNGSNQIKMAVQQDAWTGYIKVGEVKGNSVIDGKTEVSLKDYVIIEDGASITLDDLEEGDVVYYNTTNSFAEVFNNEVVGELEAVYSDGFKVDGTEYALAGTSANITFNTKYSKAGATETNVDGDYLNALKASGEDVTVRLNRANQAVFLDGTTAEVKSSTVTLVLTDVAKYYTQSLSKYIRVKGYDGSSVKTYDIDTSNISKITLSTGKTADKGKAYAGGATTISKYTFTGNGTDASIAALDSNGATIGSVTSSIATDMIKGELITLTLNDKDQVIGIAWPAAKTGSAAARFGNAAVDGAGANTALVVSATDGKFRAGYTTINGLQLASSAPVYTYDTSKDSVSKTTYGEFTGAEKTANSYGVRVYSGDGKNVSAIVIDSTALDSDSDGVTTTEGIVTRVKYDTSATPKMVEFAFLTGDEVKEYSKFSGSITTSLSVGDIVAVKVLKDGETVSGFDTTAATIGATVNGVVTVVSASDNSFKIGNNGPYQMATSGTVQYGKLENGTVTSVDLATIIKEGAENEVVATTNGTANYIDSIVVKMSTKAKALADAADAVSAALANLSAVMTKDGGAGHVTGNTDQVDNAGDYALVKAAYDNVTNMYNAWKELKGATATNLANDFAGDANVGDYATADTEMDAWKGVEATINALSLTINANTSIDLPLKGVNSAKGVATGITWAVTDGTVADATLGAAGTDTQGLTVAIAAGKVGTFKLVATITNGNSNTTVPYAVLCGTADGATTNTIQSVSEIVDETKYDNAAGAMVDDTYFKPASLVAADNNTLKKYQDGVKAAADANATLDGYSIDWNDLALKNAAGTAAGTGVATDKWVGNLIVSSNGAVETIAVSHSLTT